MKRIIIFLVFSLFLTSTNYSQEKEVVGSWMGNLKAGAVNLRIIFNISGDAPDYIVTLDSPDQGAKGIAIGPVKLKGDSIIISAASLMGEYKGVFEGGKKISGTWYQAGQAMPLDLEIQEEEFKMLRPQEPKAPCPMPLALNKCLSCFPVLQ